MFQPKQYRQYGRLNDKKWLKTLLDSVDGRASVPMPTFPPADLQAGFVGSSNEQAIREAWKFYKLMAVERKKYGLTIGYDSHVLDFGCGWGRFARMFLRDVPADNIWCADSWDLAITTCRETGVPGQMIQLEQMPPSTLPAQQFDTAFAYSVFSHLSPTAHLAWKTEFARVMKPGGLLFITTQARWFIDYCEDLRDHPEKVTSYWHELLFKSFRDFDACLARYDRGEFLYAPNGGGASLAPEYYGDAVVPRDYFEREWGSNFEVLDFIAERSQCEQAVAIMRRRR
jgi:ubiquinone/menaquinone biosynthesis C-methylase UbiE